MSKNLDFKVAPKLLELAYQGDVDAFLAIAKKAHHEQRFGLATNFYRLANEALEKNCHRHSAA